MRKLIKVLFSACLVIFLIALGGSYYATKKHNDTVNFIELNPSTIEGTVVKASSNDHVIKDNYEFVYENKKYSGTTYLNNHLSIGAAICLKFNKNKPTENVYCAENNIMRMNYYMYSIQVVGVFVGLVFLGLIWECLKKRKLFK